MQIKSWELVKAITIDNHYYGEGTSSYFIRQEG